MELGQIIFLLFIIYRIYSWIKKSTENNTSTPVSPKRRRKRKKTKSLDDILGDFMNELEGKKSKKVFVKDVHTAEDDSAIDIDWQDVETSQIIEKKRLLKHSDYANINYSTTDASEIDDVNKFSVIDSDFDSENNILEEIDLRKAVLYKEILDRKYFSV